VFTEVQPGVWVGAVCWRVAVASSSMAHMPFIELCVMLLLKLLPSLLPVLPMFRCFCAGSCTFGGADYATKIVVVL
jgi:hypothetical protein